MTPSIKDHNSFELLVSRADTAHIDLAAEKCGLSTQDLMNRAGEAVARCLVKELSNAKGLFILLGNGNNAGDGLAAAAVLHRAGVIVRLINCVPGAGGSSLYLKHRRLCESLGLILEPLDAAGNLPREPGWSYLDAIFGSGFEDRGGPSPQLSHLLNDLRTSQDDVYSLDVPSGITADGPFSQNTASIVPGKRVTFAIDTLKFIHIAEPPKHVVGRVHLLDIGIPMALKQDAARTKYHAYRHPVPAGAWRQVDQDIYKHGRGHVLIIGGSPGHEGAVMLSSAACLRAGAGYVTLALPPHCQERFKSAESETLGFPTEAVRFDLYDSDTLSPAKLKSFVESQKNLSAIVLGPGWLKNHVNAEIMATLSAFSERGGFIVFDAGATIGLWKLALESKLSPHRTIALPHPGEWRRLEGPLSPLEPSRLEILNDIQAEVVRFGKLTVVYKGTRPMIFSADRSSTLISMPSRRLARAGSGDILAGATAALSAVSQNVAEAFLRAYSAVWNAAESQSKIYGDDGVLPSDVVQKLGLFV